MMRYLVFFHVSYYYVITRNLPTLLSYCSRFLRALQQNSAQSRLLYLLKELSRIFPCLLLLRNHKSLKKITRAYLFQIKLEIM